MRTMIGVIGASSAGPELLDLARALGGEIFESGCSLVCGGLGGVMEAACQGACEARRAAGGRIDGVTVGILPSSSRADANPCVDIAIPTGMGLARNALVVLAADGVIAVGGGSGTLSEIAFAWQLCRPIVALLPAGGWGAELGGRRIDDRYGTAIGTAERPAEAVAALLQRIKRLGPLDPPGLPPRR